jgi:hypothetical protein
MQPYCWQQRWCLLLVLHQLVVNLLFAQAKALPEPHVHVFEPPNTLLTGGYVLANGSPGVRNAFFEEDGSLLLSSSLSASKPMLIAPLISQWISVIELHPRHIDGMMDGSKASRHRHQAFSPPGSALDVGLSHQLGRDCTCCIDLNHKKQ